MNTFWQERRVLVTGATGVVGGSLIAELLARGADVVALVLDADPQTELYRSGVIDRVHVVNGALEDVASLERAINRYEIETVFHLGAQTLVGAAQRAPLPTFEANIRGTYHVLESCRIHRTLVRAVVVASSDKAYGEQDELPYRESAPLIGRHPYDVSKSCADLVAQAYHHTYGLPVAIARCGNIYGGGDLNWSRLIPGTIRSFLRQERPVIRSDGRYVRDYLYVGDAVAAYLRLAEAIDDDRVRGQAFNFSTEHPLSVLDVVGAIGRMMRCEHLEPEVRNMACGEIRAQYLSAAKARHVLHWAPRYPLDEGLAETIGWYREYLRPVRSASRQVQAGWS